MSVGSLFTAISGLRTHQTSLNVIGNNLSNINTVGYKKSRVTFREIFNRIISQGSSPTEQTGSINSMQIGFGAQLSSIDTAHTQGSLQTTGNPTDLSIRGNGYFVLRNTKTVGGEKNYNLTRAGNFSVDLAGNLIYTPNGFRVQGWIADAAGKIDSSAGIDDIKLPLQEKIARATDKIAYGGNLDARAGQAVIVSGGAEVGLSSAYIPSRGNISPGEHTVNVTSPQAGVFEAAVDGGQAAQVAQGQEMTLIPADVTQTVTLNLNPANITQEGKAIIEVANGQIVLASASTDELRTQLSDQANLTLPVDNALQDGVYTITVTQDADTGNFEASLEAGPKMQAAAGMILAKGDISKAIVIKFADIANLATGDITVDVGLTGAIVTDTGTTGVTTSQISADIPSASELPSDTHVVNVTDLGDGRFLASLNGGPGVDVAPGGTFTLTSGNLGGRQEGGTLTVTFGSQIKEGAVEIEAISRSRRVSMTTYDALGGPHNAEITFTKIDSNTWIWRVTDVSNIKPGTIFKGEGGLNVNTLTGSVSIAPPTVPISFTPINDAGVVNISLDNRSFENITQFSADYDITGLSQNGIPVGELFALRVDNEGKLVGVFTNGLSLNLAQVSLATVPNSGGLERAGDTLFRESLSSGTARFSTPGKIGLGEIESGSLEMSNVDLTEEFTALIIAERGFQANSRVVVTSDEVLIEALGLKR